MIKINDLKKSSTLQSPLHAFSFSQPETIFTKRDIYPEIGPV